MKLNRTLYRALLIASFVLVNALLLFGIGAVWSYLNTGADRSTMLHLPQTLAATYRPHVEWDTMANEGRPMETQTLMEIERDYLKAWQLRNLALESNDPHGISDYYTDSARVKLYQMLDLNRASNTSIKTSSLRHHPTLEFYSADGKIVVLTDKNVERYEAVYSNDSLILEQKLTTSFQVMLLLEDGFWRIRHMVEGEPTFENGVPSPENPPSVDTISKIKGINYYPRATPWAMFGEAFDETIIGNDFASIKSLGINTVRIFVPYADFGKAELRIDRLERLKQTLDLAEHQGLQVMVTLFDFYGDYDIRDWTLTHRHAEEIVKSLKEHKALLAWDIKNEPDLDFDSRGKERVMAWLGQMISEIKRWDSKHPVTIGWSHPSVAPKLSEEVDFVSFHYYGEPSDFSTAYAELQQAVPKKPLLLQEYGYSSYNGLWNLYLGSEEDQASYFTQMRESLKTQGLPHMFWTLYDFESVPEEVVGKLPWRKAKQRHFGLLDREGNPKPVWDIVNQKK